MGRVTVTSFDARRICDSEAHESHSTVSEHAVTDRPRHFQVAHGLARVVGGLALFAACAAAPAQVQMEVQAGQSPQSGAEDPFFKDAKVGYHFRTFFMDKENPNGSINEAWAAGGWLHGRTGFWRDTLQLGATYYFSLPVYAPDDKGGTQLLTPDQGSISVLGELYARLRYEKQTLTLYRQEINMGYPRPAGARSNRSDLSYVGKLDNRMVPVTYQAALLGGPIASDSTTIGTLSCMNCTGHSIALAQGEPAGKHRKGDDDADDDIEAVSLLRQWNSANVHAQEPGDDIDRQRQNGDHSQGEQAAAGLLAHLRRHFLLQQLDALLQLGKVADDERELLGGLAQVFQCWRCDPGWWLAQQAE